MSKAFVADENANILELERPDDPLDAEIRAAGGVGNYITPSGLEQLQAELDRVAFQPEAQRQARLLRHRLDTAVVVDPEKQRGERALFGATVTVIDEDENERVYQIVGVNETDFARGRVSWISPIGRALLQKREGDVATVQTPRGPEDLEILKVEFRRLD